jgi:uncharacterized membrane protein
MTAIVILNIVFAVFVVGGIVGLLSRAILVGNPGIPPAAATRAPADPRQVPPRAGPRAGLRPVIPAAHAAHCPTTAARRASARAVPAAQIAWPRAFRWMRSLE